MKLFRWKLIKTRYGYGVMCKHKIYDQYRVRVFTKKDREHYYGLGK